MSFRDEAEEGRDLRKPFLHTGSWYRMGSRQSSMMTSSAQVLRDGSVSVVLCVLIVALGPIQFGFTVTNLNSLFFLSYLFNFVYNHRIIVIFHVYFHFCFGFSVGILLQRNPKSYMILNFLFQKCGFFLSLIVVLIWVSLISFFVYEVLY